MTIDDLPDLALSIQQPWSALIVHGHKNIENRDWKTNRRGLIVIHAGQKIDTSAHRDVREGFHPVSGEEVEPGRWDGIADQPIGGIVGVAEIIGCVPTATSKWRSEYREWFVGKYGFVLANQRPVPFIPCKGALGFFRWKDRLI